MGGSSHTTQTQDQTTHLVQTPTNPPWVDSTLQGLTGNLAKLSSADPRSFVAGPDPLQTLAGTYASQLTGNPGNYAGATDIQGRIANTAAPSVGMVRALPYINDYMSPYINDVVSSTLAGFDNNAGRVRAQQMLDLGNDSTFGGSGGSILRGVTEGQLALQRAQEEAAIRNQGFTTALDAANNDANRGQSAANLTAQLADSNLTRQLAASEALVNTGNSYNNAQNQLIGTQASIGSILQGLEQAKLGAPLTVNSTLAGIAGSLPLGLEHGQIDDGTSHTTTDSRTTQSNPLGTIGSLAMLAAAPFTGGASLFSGMGGIMGGLGALGAMGGGSGNPLTGLSNYLHNDPTGMWSLGSAVGH